MQEQVQDRPKYKALRLLPEALCWATALVLLAGMEPGARHLLSLCPASWWWERGCPGCGLGHSIAYLFRGDFQAAWEAHPLGVPAVCLLIRRIVELLAQARFLYLYHSKL